VAQVLISTFHEIDVLSPTARETNPNGSGTVTGPVAISVHNVDSGTSTTSPTPFRYLNKMQITSVSPTFGSALGGTNILIDGIGFTDGATVDVGDFRASVIKVTGTEVTARTAPIPIPCTGTSRLDVKVTNIDNGDTATSPTVFSYVGVPSIITSVIGPSPTNIGSALTVNVQNPGVGLLGTATVAFTVGGLAANATPQQISTGTGTQAFTVIVPPNVPFPTVACVVGIIPGTKLGDITLPVTFTNLTTGCTATAPNAITVSPVGPNPCVVPPPAASLVSPAQTCPTIPNLTPASQTAAGVVTHGATITIANTGGQTLTLGPPLVTLANATPVSSNISPATGASVAPGGTTSYTITIDPAAAGADGATITFTTNDPTKPVLTVTVCGTGT
jgi:hypothetical protein